MANTTVNFSGSKLTLVLEAQTPLIHFQHKEKGATLRGSELKPKLDKFLCRKMGKKEKDAIPMKYKVRIRWNDENFDRVSVGIRVEEYSLFYGNTKEIKSKGIWSEPELTIICFDKELQKYIAENIVEFFYITNFGTMQNKGFGSFIPKVKRPSASIISKWLKDAYGTQTCWRCRYNNNESNRIESCKNQFKWIKSFYSIMKSGQNFNGHKHSFLFQYMHKSDEDVGNTDNIKENIDNEKAWMIQQGIAPRYSSNKDNESKHDIRVENPKYVRAFMGLAGIQNWKCSDDETTEITIYDSNKIFERIPSPVFFKIVGNSIYFVITKIPDSLYNYEFTFEGCGKTATLKTPLKEEFENNEFDVEQFMTQYVDNYNNKYVNHNTWEVNECISI